ncbi:hypothetical protein [Terasakiella pusilla]|uniref:hypothetical protein n=1 Tax=Terasakiella pusilla TaxID=64973 RepID=UPI003AA965E6
MSNFVLAQRDRFKHPLFRSEKLCRLAAWDWIVAHAVWRREGLRTDINGKTVLLERGQLSYSVRYLADAWNWSKSAVDRFLARLETETMIETATGTGQLVITVCNYDKYQDQKNIAGTATEPLTGTAAGQQRDSSGTNKNQDNQDNQENRERDARDENEAWVLEEGQAYLIAAGSPETQAPRLIDEWLKAYPAKQVRDAIAQAQIGAAGSPPAYIAKVLRNGQYSNLKQFPVNREQSRKEAEQAEIERIRAERAALREEA